jgi:hypothetical protein
MPMTITRKKGQHNVIALRMEAFEWRELLRLRTDIGRRNNNRDWTATFRCVGEKLILREAKMVIDFLPPLTTIFF